MNATRWPPSRKLYVVGHTALGGSVAVTSVGERVQTRALTDDTKAHEFKTAEGAAVICGRASAQYADYSWRIIDEASLRELQHKPPRRPRKTPATRAQHIHDTEDP